MIGARSQCPLWRSSAVRCQCRKNVSVKECLEIGISTKRILSPKVQGEEVWRNATITKPASGGMASILPLSLPISDHSETQSPFLPRLRGTKERRPVTRIIFGLYQVRLSKDRVESEIVSPGELGLAFLRILED